MKTALILPIIIFRSLLSFSQTGNPVFLNPGSVYYDSTDFSKGDSLKDWSYVLVINKQLTYEDSVKFIGQLVFFKAKTIGNPSINFTFRIFEIQDSSYCFKKSVLTRAKSHCAPPDIGGDIVIIDHYLFLNTSTCLPCKNSESGSDFCRPAINKIFSNVHSVNTNLLESFVKQFPIKGEVMYSAF
jgi:hypothetical protein